MLDQEMILSDLVVAEKRAERLELDRKRGKNIEHEEIPLLKECIAHLENEIPLRRFPELAYAPRLKGYGFVSAKPVLTLFNNEDDDEKLPDIPDSLKSRFESEQYMTIRGKLEHEIARMSDEEVSDFLHEFNIAESAADRVIKKSYELLNLITFFTVGEDEVRAWSIKKGTPASDAAGTIHSDMKKGFIRAEVISFEDLIKAGNYQEAKKRGMIRLEGKTYEVQDGDIITVRFNV
jgi:ribosome-binding ATPase YchF (GTP1/OBG family)